MKKCLAFCAIFTLLICLPGYGQIKSELINKYRGQETLLPGGKVIPAISLPDNFPQPKKLQSAATGLQVNSLQQPVKMPTAHRGLRITRCNNTKLPVFIKGKVRSQQIGLRQNATPLQHSLAYLAPLQKMLRINDPAAEFQMEAIKTDRIGNQHVRLQQYYHDLEVVGGQMTLHYADGEIESLSSRHFPTPELSDLDPCTDRRRSN